MKHQLLQEIQKNMFYFVAFSTVKKIFIVFMSKLFRF